MTTQELEQAIRDYLMDTYKKNYIGKLDIKKIGNGFHIALGLNVPEKPQVIYAEADDDELLEFLKKELKSRLYHLSHFAQLSLQQPYDCCKRNTQCGCNDKGRIN